MADAIMEQINDIENEIDITNKKLLALQQTPKKTIGRLNLHRKND